MIDITIDGPPTPWTAPRVTRKRTYSVKSREKKRAQWQVRLQWRKAPISTAVFLQFSFHMPIPSGTSQIRRQKMLDGLLRHTKRPDTSNLVKFAEDCLKGIVLKDDNQVCELRAEKIYSLAPKTMIKVFLL